MRDVLAAKGIAHNIAKILNRPIMHKRLFIAVHLNWNSIVVSTGTTIYTHFQFQSTGMSTIYDWRELGSKGLSLRGLAFLDADSKPHRLSNSQTCRRPFPLLGDKSVGALIVVRLVIDAFCRSIGFELFMAALTNGHEVVTGAA